MSDLNRLLCDAGPLRPKAGTAPAPQQVVVASSRVAIESLPALTIESLPAPKSYVHRIVRDSDGRMTEIVSTPF